MRQRARRPPAVRLGFPFLCALAAALPAAPALADPATHFLVSVPASATAGSPFTITVSALDGSNSVDPTYTGTVHFTSSDSGAGSALPADATFGFADFGVLTFTNGVTFVTAGSQTVTVTDTVLTSITGTSSGVAVSADAATHFSVSAPATASINIPLTFSVTALDQFSNTATGYAGIVHFTSTDGAAILPADSTLASGAGTFSATLRTLGSQTITATDTVSSSITGTSNGIVVTLAPATHFQVTAPASATAGSAFSIMVTALDASNGVATGYTGTVHFTKTDAGAGSALPADYTFTGGDAGVHTFTNGVTLVTAGMQTVTATDTVSSSTTGTSNIIAVSAAAATHFTVSAPATATANVPVSFTVTALDQFNNTAAGYSGVVHFTSTDGSAVLPANSTLAAGTGPFSATLKTVGSQTITATDTVSPSITGTSNAITVSAAGPATHFSVSAPASATAGTAFNFTVTALDASNATATGYAGTVHFTSSDGAAILPADATLSAGAGTFSATLKTAGSQTLTATDTGTGTIAGSATVVVGAAGGAAIPTLDSRGMGFLFALLLAAGLWALRDRRI